MSTDKIRFTRRGFLGMSVAAGVITLTGAVRTARATAAPARAEASWS
jgi:hypothetical protein